MDDADSEILDWGQDDEHTTGARVDDDGNEEDAEDAVSLGDDEEDVQDFHAFNQQPQVPETDTEPATQSTDLSPTPLQNSPPSGITPQAYTHSTPQSSPRSKRSQSSRMTHALPPKPGVPFPSDPVPNTGAVAMSKPKNARHERDKKSISSTGKPISAAASDTDVLPPDWEIKYPTNGRGQYYYNIRTHESTWTRPRPVSPPAPSSSRRDSQRNGHSFSGAPDLSPVRAGPRSNDVREYPGSGSTRDLTADDRHYAPSATRRRDDRPEVHSLRRSRSRSPPPRARSPVVIYERGRSLSPPRRPRPPQQGYSYQDTAEPRGNMDRRRRETRTSPERKWGTARDSYSSRPVHMDRTQSFHERAPRRSISPLEDRRPQRIDTDRQLPRIDTDYPRSASHSNRHRSRSPAPYRDPRQDRRKDFDDYKNDRRRDRDDDDFYPHNEGIGSLAKRRRLDDDIRGRTTDRAPYAGRSASPSISPVRSLNEQSRPRKRPPLPPQGERFLEMTQPVVPAFGTRGHNGPPVRGANAVDVPLGPRTHPSRQASIVSVRDEPMDVDPPPPRRRGRAESGMYSDKEAAMKTDLLNVPKGPRSMRENERDRSFERRDEWETRVSPVEPSFPPSGPRRSPVDSFARESGRTWGVESRTFDDRQQPSLADNARRYNNHNNQEREAQRPTFNEPSSQSAGPRGKGSNSLPLGNRNRFGQSQPSLSPEARPVPSSRNVASHIDRTTSYDRPAQPHSLPPAQDMYAQRRQRKEAQEFGQRQQFGGRAPVRDGPPHIDQPLPSPAPSFQSSRATRGHGPGNHQNTPHSRQGPEQQEEREFGSKSATHQWDERPRDMSLPPRSISPRGWAASPPPRSASSRHRDFSPPPRSTSSHHRDASPPPRSGSSHHQDASPPPRAGSRLRDVSPPSRPASAGYGDDTSPARSPSLRQRDDTPPASSVPSPHLDASPPPPSTEPSPQGEASSSHVSVGDGPLRTSAQSQVVRRPSRFDNKTAVTVPSQEDTGQTINLMLHVQPLRQVDPQAPPIPIPPLPEPEPRAPDDIVADSPARDDHGNAVAELRRSRDVRSAEEGPLRVPQSFSRGSPHIPYRTRPNTYESPDESGGRHDAFYERSTSPNNRLGPLREPQSWDRPASLNSRIEGGFSEARPSPRSREIDEGRHWQAEDPFQQTSKPVRLRRPGPGGHPEQSRYSEDRHDYPAPRTPTESYQDYGRGVERRLSFASSAPHPAGADMGGRRDGSLLERLSEPNGSRVMSHVGRTPSLHQRMDIAEKAPIDEMGYHGDAADAPFDGHFDDGTSKRGRKKGYKPKRGRRGGPP